MKELKKKERKNNLKKAPQTSKKNVIPKRRGKMKIYIGRSIYLYTDMKEG